YYPEDGRLLLKARQRARDSVLDLFQRFGRAVLGNTLDASCLRPAFRLDLFKRPFDPPLDGPDMERARVKALCLAEPESFGRRRITLETLSGDGQFAIIDLLREHGGREEVLERLEVLSAELEVVLRREGRRKTYPVRLWPDRCTLNQTPL